MKADLTAGEFTPGRIVVRSVNWLGDAVMAVPALIRLGERFPAAQIAVLSPVRLAPLWKRVPVVHEVLTIEPGRSPLRVGAALRRRAFDAGLVLPNSPRTALELRVGRVPLRTGYSGGWRSALLTHPIPLRKSIAAMRKRTAAEIRELISGGGEAPVPSGIPLESHHVFHYLHLVAAAFGANPEPVRPELRVDDSSRDAFRGKFDLPAGGAGAALVGLNPGAEYGPAKRWPAGRFVEAAIELRRRRNCTLLLFGVTGDPACAEVAQGLRESGVESSFRDLAGRTSLDELLAGLSLCDAVLTNDSGPMHVAAALGVGVVAPFGSTSPELTGPGLPGGDSRIEILRHPPPCAPCFLRECPIDFRCMKAIAATEAVEAVERLLDA